MILKDQIMKELETVIDPELGINVVDLGLIYELHISDENDVEIVMTLTTPGCPLHDSITNGAKFVVEALEGVNDVNVKLVWEPAWSPDKMSDRARDLLG